MSSATGSEPTPSPGASRGRGRGKSRGGLGKYLRARGRGRGGPGRPAEFHKRLLLEGEAPDDLDDEEAAAVKAELARKYGKRGLQSNQDRYKEEEPELDSDGEPIVEPEVDLSDFLEKQRQVEDTGASNILGDQDDEDDVDHSLAHLSLNKGPASTSKKGKIEAIEWDHHLEDMRLAKEREEANRDLKSRFRARTTQLAISSSSRGLPVSRKTRQELHRTQAPPLPLPEGAPPPPDPTSKAAMEDFLDDLLT